jgi:Skp family chaperone for outer membrane proteins
MLEIRTSRLLATVAVLAFTSPLGALRAQGTVPPTRIAVFDSRVVFDSMPERRRAESDFALEQSKARTLIGAVTDSLRVAVDEFAQVEQRVSPRERELLSLQLRARELMVEEMMARVDETIQRRQIELREPLAARVAAAARAVRKRAGYDLLLDLASEGLMADADPRIDLTREIIRELRTTAVQPADQRGSRNR